MTQTLDSVKLHLKMFSIKFLGIFFANTKRSNALKNPLDSALVLFHFDIRWCLISLQILHFLCKQINISVYLNASRKPQTRCYGIHEIYRSKKMLGVVLGIILM